MWWRRRETITKERYHLDHALERFEDSTSGVRAYFTNAHVAEADLLVGADGFRSAVRGQLFPEIQFEHFGFFLPQDGEVLGYPIAGTDNCLIPGKRRYNWVWYRVVDRDELTDMLTDENGTTHEISIPPPLIRKQVIQKLRNDAKTQLSRPFREILDQVRAPFFTPIYDHASPAMVRGRVAMVGDAAFVARPHIGAGVTKAAEDARSLAVALEAAETVAEGLAAFDADRLDEDRIAYERGRYLGEYLVPRYTNEAEKAEWAGHHNLATIMRDTAVLNFD
jgi:2-polyprenyl-6-methoxyphenol hydroxylase-like FAD-dependent oxidoreductase